MAFGDPKSHGCIFNVPQAGGFFRVVLKILGSISDEKGEKNPRKYRCGAGGVYGRTAVYYDPERLR